MKTAYLGLDCGTTSVKCIAVDKCGRQLHCASRVHPSISVNPGWLEQEPDSWIEPTLQVLQECAERLTDYSVAAIGFSGHMSSPVFLDRDNRPVYNCMTVGDARCEREAEVLSERFLDDFRNASGNKPMACFVAAKLLWFMRNEPEKYRETVKFVFAKDYIRYVLTGVLNTDLTDAGNVLLYDYKNGCWDDALIRQLGLRREIFPDVVSSLAQAGTLRKEIACRCSLPEGVAVFCGAADMACSQIGTASFDKGVLALTLSTSGQICTYVDEPNPQGYGRVTFHPGVIPGTMYTMASVFSGGLALNWCYELLSGKKELSGEDFADMQRLSAESVQYMPGKSGTVFLPFLSGSGSPYFDSGDRSAFFGLSTATNRAALFAAVVEGVCLHIYENVHLFGEMGYEIRQVHLSGGGSRNPYWVQTLSDVLGMEIQVLDCPDASSIGAAYLALNASEGIDLRELSARNVTVKQTVHPNMENHAKYEELYGIFERFYSSVGSLKREMTCFMEENDRYE